MVGQIELKWARFLKVWFQNRRAKWRKTEKNPNSKDIKNQSTDDDDEEEYASSSLGGEDDDNEENTGGGKSEEDSNHKDSEKQEENDKKPKKQHSVENEDSAEENSSKKMSHSITSLLHTNGHNQKKPIESKTKSSDSTKENSVSDIKS